MKTQNHLRNPGSNNRHLHLAQILNEVVGERIVIVQHQNHSTGLTIAETTENERENESVRSGENEHPHPILYGILAIS
jgi:hypothetical protein